MMKIAVKYKIPLVGKYWAGINSCPECGHFPDTVISHLIGFSECNGEEFAVAECPKCFAHWYFHNRGDGSMPSMYELFLENIDLGGQKHFKKIK